MSPKKPDSDLDRDEKTLERLPAKEDPAGSNACETPYSPTDHAHSVPGHRLISESPQIANYRIVQMIGEGGMGEVWEAQQERPVRRKVAIKVIKLGMDTKSVVARFESERQALALMDHSNIARVLDAGATETGRPFFAMEYVRGVPITDYCDTHRLTTKERLELFAQVCEGVQHAHQRAIIHRDLKPSNVLVEVQNDKPVPKIIDFGLAKALAQRLTERTVYTELGHLVGTPEYMSPEQAEMTGLDVDTRTDIYSLGVMLYSLLVGELPFSSKELRQEGFEEIRRKIRDTEPTKPSTRISDSGHSARDIAHKRNTDFSTLRKQLRGDLDWVVMKAMAKDRTRRYASASELEADIHRYLSHKPVLASPPSATYRMRKFVRRHRVGVAAAALVLLALVLGVTGTTIGWIEATQARRLAAEEAATSQQVSDFLLDLFEVSNPSVARGNSITAREILDRGAERIEKELEDQHVIQARMMATIGHVYRRLGLYDQARSLLEKALVTSQAQFGKESLEVASIQQDLGWLMRLMGDFEAAWPLHEQALATREKLLGPNHPDVAHGVDNLAVMFHVTGDYASARTQYERALEIYESALGPEDPRIAIVSSHLAILLRDYEGDYQGALPLWQRAVAIQEAQSPYDPELAKFLFNLAILYQETEDFQQALQLYERTLAIQEQNRGPHHPRVAATLNKLASLYIDMGDYEKARPLAERAKAIQDSALPPEHPDRAWSLDNLANLSLHEGDFENARLLVERAQQLQEKAFGREHPALAHYLNSRATILREAGDPDAAGPLYERALSIREKALAADHPQLVEILTEYATLLRRMGQIDHAEELEARAQSIRTQRLGNG